MCGRRAVARVVARHARVHLRHKRLQPRRKGGRACRQRYERCRPVPCLLARDRRHITGELAISSLPAAPATHHSHPLPARPRRLWGRTAPGILTGVGGRVSRHVPWYQRGGSRCAGDAQAVGGGYCTSRHSRPGHASQPTLEALNRSSWTREGASLVKAVWQAGAKAAAAATAGRAEAAATPPRRMAAAASILRCDIKRAEESALIRAQFEAGTRHTIGGAGARVQAATGSVKRDHGA